MSGANRIKRIVRIEAVKYHTGDGIDGRRGMKKNGRVAAIAVACIGMSVAAATPGLVGLGVMAGEPSGFSAEFWLGNHVAIAGGPGHAYLWNRAGGHLHGDPLFHTGSPLLSPVGFLPLHARAGVRVRLANGVGNPREVGHRVPFGAEYALPIVPPGVFPEPAPILDFAPAIGFNGAVGFRHYFGPRRRKPQAGPPSFQRVEGTAPRCREESVGTLA